MIGEWTGASLGQPRRVVGAICCWRIGPDDADEPQETELDRAARARQSLDADTERRLRELLDEGQEGRLPERQPEPEEPWTVEGEVIQVWPSNAAG